LAIDTNLIEQYVARVAQQLLIVHQARNENGRITAAGKLMKAQLLLIASIRIIINRRFFFVFDFR
jgi:hypothetical protein